MSDIDTPVVESEESLDDFSADFFGTKPEVVEEVEDVEEVSEETESDDTVEETDAEEDEDSEPDDADDSEESDDEPEAEQPKKNRKSAKERISEVIAERRAAEARAAALELRIAELTAAREESPQEEVVPPQRTAVVDPDAPDPEAKDESGELIYPLGPFDPQYQADLTRFIIRKETEAAREEATREEEAKQVEAAKSELITEWNGKLEETEKELPDLREKIQGLEDSFSDIDPEYGTFLAQTIMQMERGVEVLYYLSENPSEAEKIVSLSPVAATLALGRVEGRLPSKSTTPPKKVSKAPPPPTSPKGSNVSKRVSADTDDLEAFEREFFRAK